MATISLVPGEKILCHTKLHWIILARPAVFVLAGLPCLCCALLLAAEPPPGQQSIPPAVMAPFAICGGLFFLSAMMGVIGALIDFARFNFYLTTKRVIFERGIISLKAKEFYLHRVDGVSVEMPSRKSGYGTLIINAGGESIKLPYIADPLEVRDKMQAQISTLKVY
jgi:hypothetical protein